VKIDVVASEPHYFRHLTPIWAALPAELQGTVHPLYQPGYVSRPPMGRLALVAGWQDVAPLRGLCNMIYVEHGAGQTYADAPHDPSYSGSGGQRHRGVIGYVSPGATVASRWSQPAAAVGCPKMDARLRAPRKTIGTRPVVVFAWHWDCRIVPETRSAWQHYADRFHEIIARFEQQGFAVFCHSHPKWRGELDHTFDMLGIPHFDSEDEVFDHADVLIADNTSLAYEMALLNRPTLMLNAPWYRRDVEHGLRFWACPPGPTLSGPDELMAINLWDLFHDSQLKTTADAMRVIAVAHTYATNDGTASEKAAAFIAQLVAGM
jgi:hypothetical protein